MGALDRIVSTGGGAREEGTRAAGHGSSPRGVEGAPEAVTGTEPVETAASDPRTADATTEIPDGARADAGRRDPRDVTRLPAEEDRARGERAEHAEANLDRAAERPRDDTGAKQPRREPPQATPIAVDTGARKDAPQREGLRRVLDPAATQRPPPASRPVVTQPANDARVRLVQAPETRREQIVRERVIERTIVERLITPALPRPEMEARGAILPSLVRPPPEARDVDRSAREADRQAPPPAHRADDLRDAGEKQRRPAATPPPAPERAPDKDSRRALASPRLAPPAPQKSADPQPTTKEAPRPEARRDAPRDDRTPPGRKVETATRAPSPAPARPMANMVSPRATKPAPTAIKPPATSDTAKGTPAARERQEPRPSPRAAAQPRIQISIGRVEVRGKKAEPPLQRVSLGGPRAHQIDPGLPFGPIEGGRV